MVSHVPFPFLLQYSQKEDKYEEEIKVLTDKLKEVNHPKTNKLAFWWRVTFAGICLLPGMLR